MNPFPTDKQKSQTQYYVIYAAQYITVVINRLLLVLVFLCPGHSAVLNACCRVVFYVSFKNYERGTLGYFAL